MPVLSTVGWERRAYPAWWEGANDITKGGQQASPDCRYFWMWQTGARTGGDGRVALYSCDTDTWKYGTFPAACEPRSFSIPTTVPGVTDQVGTFFDHVTEAINYVFFNGGSIPPTHRVNGFDLYRNGTPFGVGFSISGKLITLLQEPNIVYGVYGGSLNLTNNGLMDFRPASRYNSIFLTGDEALDSLGRQGSTAPGFVGGNLGNGSQTTLPLRYYYDPTGMYCIELGQLRDNPVADSAYWNTGVPVHQPFPSKIYRQGNYQSICNKTNTNFEQTLYNLGTTSGNPFINFDLTSFVIPTIAASKLTGVSHVPFNTSLSLFGLPIAVAVPNDFTSANWSIWELAGTTWIFDDAGNFFRLAISQIQFQFFNVNNWRRMFNYGEK